MGLPGILVHVAREIELPAATDVAPAGDDRADQLPGARQRRIGVTDERDAQVQHERMVARQQTRLLDVAVDQATGVTVDRARPAR